MWTHIARTDSAIDSQIFPRLIALAEVLWTEKSNTNLDDFHRRLGTHYPVLERMGVKYGFEAHPVSIKTVFDQDRKKLEIQMFSGINNAEIRYTITDSEPTQTSHLYKKSISLDETITIRARAFKNGMPIGAEIKKQFIKHLAIGKKVQLKNRFSKKYMAGGEFGLTDGISGSVDFIAEKWQGFEGEHFEAVIDLEEMIRINKISISFLQNLHKWIFPPLQVSFSVSENGKDYQVVKSIDNKIEKELNAPDILAFSTQLKNRKTRYIKISARSIINCPEWHESAGSKAWLFVDEIIIK